MLPHTFKLDMRGRIREQGTPIFTHFDEEGWRLPGIDDCFVANGSPFRRARANEKTILLCCSRSVNRFFYELRRVGFRARRIKDANGYLLPV